jgi:hypothetical protein
MVSVDGATARVEAIAVDGTKLDSFEFHASPQK